jgi:hypothetical protein
MLNCMSMQASIFKQYKLFIILGITLGLTATVLVTYANTSELSEPIDNEVIETIVIDTEEVNSVDPTILENQEEAVTPEAITDPSLLSLDEPVDEATTEETTLTLETEDILTDPETTINLEATEPVEEDALAPTSETTEPATTPDTLDLPTISENLTDDSWFPLHPRDCIHGPAREQFASPGECMRLLPR